MTKLPKELQEWVEAEALEAWPVTPAAITGAGKDAHKICRLERIAGAQALFAKLLEGAEEFDEKAVQEYYESDGDEIGYMEVARHVHDQMSAQLAAMKALQSSQAKEFNKRQSAWHEENEKLRIENQRLREALQIIATNDFVNENDEADGPQEFARKALEKK